MEVADHDAALVHGPHRDLDALAHGDRPLGVVGDLLLRRLRAQERVTPHHELVEVVAVHVLEGEEAVFADRV